MEVYVKRKIYSTLGIILFLLMFAFMIFNPMCITNHCKNAILMCAHSIVPSLFMFTVFSTMLSEICKKTDSSGKVLTFLSKLFGIDKKLIPQCLFGLFAGACPASPGLINIYSSGGVSKQNTENALMLLSGCSVPFIITVCSNVLESKELGLLLLISNFLSILTSFFILCKRDNNSTKVKLLERTEKSNFFKIIGKSLENSTVNTFNMCSYIIFFSVLSGAVCDIVAKLGVNNSLVETVLFGLFEASSGVIHSSSLFGNERIMLVCFICAFSGISIIFQIAGICSPYGISIKKFILSRLLSSILCPLYMLIFMMVLPFDITCFTHTTELERNIAGMSQNSLILTFITSVVVYTVALFIVIDKKHKKSVQN